MAKEESFWETLFKIGAIIGGAWLFAELLRNMSPYKCPVCGEKVIFSEIKCPRCNTKLEWCRHYG